MVDASSLADKTKSLVSKLVGARDYIVLAGSVEEIMVRFHNNKVSVSKHIKEHWVELCLIDLKKRVVGSTSQIDDRGLERLIETLRSSLKIAPEMGEMDIPAPGTYSHNGDVDKSVLNADIGEIVSSAINSSIENGASRVAGILRLSIKEISVRNSNGVECDDTRSSCMVNVRGFSDGEASGQGLSVSTKISRLDPERAGREAGELALLAKRTEKIEEGSYNVVLRPIVAADLIQHVGWAASAYNVLTGFSFFDRSQLGREVVSSKLTIIDHGQIIDGVHSRMFDDEGRATSSNVVIEDGVLTTLLHNSATARELSTEPTGNAGLIVPRPWNLEVKPGDASLDELVKELGDGLVVTSNWYTRFQNFKTGEYSTLPRDATLLVRNGEVKGSVRGIRLSGRMLEDLSRVRLVSKERAWVKWWEVETPVLAPSILIDGVRVTKPW